jgi:hypothetical protein
MYYDDSIFREEYEKLRELSLWCEEKCIKDDYSEDSLKLRENIRTFVRKEGWMKNFDKGYMEGHMKGHIKGQIKG